MIDRTRLIDFVRQSNKIEGITRAPTAAEVEATEVFVLDDGIDTDTVRWLVSAYQPDAVLRDSPGLDVVVGPHRPPPGGRGIAMALDLLLYDVQHLASPYDVHCRYETLHPFTDGNGRSGRALWLWQIYRAGGLVMPLLGFLHWWYYASLQAWDQRKG